MCLCINNYKLYSCSGSVPFLTADDFEKHLVAVLEKVRENIPRVFVNIGELFNISLVRL